MAQQGSELVVKSDDLSSTTGTTWWKQRTSSHKLPSDLHTTYSCTHTKQNKVCELLMKNSLYLYNTV